MKSLFRLFKFVKPYRRDAILALVLLVCVVIADLAVPRLTQRVIDDGIKAQDMRLILTTALLMFGASVLEAAFSVGNVALSVRVGLNAGADIRSALVRKVQTLSFGNLDRLQTGQLLVRATSDINQVQMIFMMGLRILTRAPLWAAGSVVMLVVTTPRLAWLWLAMLPALFGIMALFTFKARPLFLIVQQKLDKLNTVMQENLAGIRVVKAFVRAAHEQRRFARANDDLMAQTIRVLNLVVFLMPLMMTITNIATAGVIWFGGNLAVQGDITVGQIMAAVNYMIFSLFPLMMLIGMIAPLAAAEVSAQRILEVLDSEPEVQPRPETQAPAARAGRVVFSNVCFSYNHGCADAVLSGVTLVAEPGETVAILGATGSGKSSLIHLIPRFYDVAQGQVTLDGVDVRDWPLHDLRAQVGMALQEAVLFSGTVRDNIRYGRPDAADDEVIAAAKAAQAHDFIMAMPDGYDTLVGQRGVNLSGGQKQRMAIARALCVKPRVLILDDSTSAVDVETESKLQDALDELLRTQLAHHTTVFVVAQRISTVLTADKIVVLDKGRIADVGTHTELLARSPIYQEIYESQLGNGKAN
ncbi:MAG TPA: ABC transporter ATP-binding protein [Anaerolineae bacterium]|nr:ABC transporter ATP-binding protein [Anaerolineae bacterium]